MDNGMPYDPIQGQGHGASEVPKIALFKVYLLRHLQWEVANNHRFLNLCIISNFDPVRCLYLSWFMCHVTLNLEGSLWLVRPQNVFPISMKYGM